MKISFSTVGCPGWSFGEIVSAARDLGYDGIEIRGVGSELFAPRTHPFSPDGLPATARMLRGASLAIPALDSSCCLGCGDYHNNEAEGKAYIDLAAKLGAACVRVMISPHPQPEPADEDAAARMAAALCDYAGKEVAVLVETNGIFCDTKKLGGFVRSVSRANLGVLWDVHHPLRFGGESVEESFSNIGGFVRHVHLKDSVMKDGAVEYRMAGHGDVPVPDALKLLRGAGYAGYLSLEWVKRWNADLEEPGIVFAHFADYIRRLLARL